MYVQNIIVDTACENFLDYRYSSASPEALYELTKGYVYIANQESLVVQNDLLIIEEQ